MIHKANKIVGEHMTRCTFVNICLQLWSVLLIRHDCCCACILIDRESLKLVPKMALKKWNTNFRLEHSVRKNRTTFLDFPLFLGIFQWDEPTKRVPFTAEPEIPEIWTKWKAPFVSAQRLTSESPICRMCGKKRRKCN